MTAFLIATLIISVAIAGAIELAHWLGDDGGPRRGSLRRSDDTWSDNLPTRPYALR